MRENEASLTGVEPGFRLRGDLSQVTGGRAPAAAAKPAIPAEVRNVRLDTPFTCDLPSSA